MLVTKRSLSRRTMLKGIGATIGLPFLESMIPAFARSAQAVTKQDNRRRSLFFGKIDADRDLTRSLFVLDREILSHRLILVDQLR